MSEDIKALLDFMQQVDKILNYIKEIKTENKQLKEQLQQKDEVIEEAILFIENHSRFEPPHYDYREFNNMGNLSELLDILNKYKD